jgi:hypothetical protein
MGAKKQAVFVGVPALTSAAPAGRVSFRPSPRGAPRRSTVDGAPFSSKRSDHHPDFSFTFPSKLRTLERFTTNDKEDST